MADYNVPSMQEMLEAGVHFGHKVSRGNPRMKPYVFGARDGIHIIDLALSEKLLTEAAQAAYNYGAEGKVMMVVGTKKQAREVVAELAKQADTPFINLHWVGGLLTNFEEVRRNINKLNSLKKEQIEGTLTRYTKREQLLIARKVEKFDRELGGVATMEKLPDFLFILDAVADQTAVKEALRVNIPMIGISDSNANPDQLDFAVPANDDGIKAIKLTADTIINAYIAGKKAAGAAAVAAEKKAEAKAKKEAEAAQEALDPTVAEQAAVIEEEVEKEEAK